MLDFATVKLGKLPPRHNMRVPMLANYTAALPQAPDVCNWAKGQEETDFGTMMNTALGDCTCAGMGHAIQIWTLAATGKMATVSDQAILTRYEAFGYRPGDPASDQGAVETDVLDYWLKTPLDGHAIDGYVGLQPKDIRDIKDAIWIFGGAYIGVALPLTAQNQTAWTVTPQGLNGDGEPGSWGGHCVFVVGYDSRFVSFISWGKLMRMSWNFWWAYTDESYGIVASDWIAAAHNAPSGFNKSALLDDLAILRAAA
jgi:hypothetical protein